MKADGKNELAQAYLFANVAQYRDELEGIVETLRVEKNRQKDDAITALNATLATTTTAIAIVTGIAIILLTLSVRCSTVRSPVRSAACRP